ncbi:MAG: DNA/RNA nuclease SfsA [Clostridia bacterium]|nr:DNA/RNA nuclease SfsA [Clostridia bacterium]MBR5986501.1 DNA/RNA nuclease SfsA [Clostridia bacterium]MBR6008269.1 DNA/RNA nuclease SfsA [Clostridia bacterium]MBR6498167.1 DNA/RNA nuclease SfsA [Clostridia bacterium]
MKYPNITRGAFIDRPNRFTAHVDINGSVHTVHVKNTGRCGELLLPGAEVFLTAPGTPGRKTVYDLVAVTNQNGLVVNIDSQAPNAVAKEWLSRRGYDRIVPEYRFGDSRLDFYMEKGAERCLMEVKGCTLEREGVGYFPDAPTLRGARHLSELANAVKQGYTAYLAFVIQMEGVYEVRPNTDTDPAFALALENAERAGVRVLFLPCRVTPDTLSVND